MRRLHVIVGAVTLSVAASAATVIVSPAVSGAASSLQSTYNAALAYAGSQNVHYVSKATQQGAILQVVGDTGSKSGKESFTVTEGSTVEKLTTVLIGSTGYLRANEPGLKTILGLTSKQSKTYANRWLSFPATNQSLAQLVSGLRNKDVASELELTGPYTAGSIKTIDGHAAQGIIGTTKDTSGTAVPTTLYVETGSTPRPLAEVTTPGEGSTDPAATVTFSNWGQATHVTKPTHTVALLSLVPTG